MAGGPALFGYLSYDAARHLERLPDLAAADLALPQARFLAPRYTAGVDAAGAWVSAPAGESPEWLASLVGLIAYDPYTLFAASSATWAWTNGL